MQNNANRPSPLHFSDREMPAPEKWMGIMSGRNGKITKDNANVIRTMTRPI
ncbi:hypothetical protein Mpt1_c03550 [Candidatus Methanoplasma termitum]|uniref:Uncharacterized protein n=1 Tax=Candidatus Methanoplasma termitum TaxID=1577791 RepID=A0A0A7LFI1_9ARCH|nr:hypothetical protein Mpt1_c03550 [Candidatus Methanoplasma termitum]